MVESSARGFCITVLAKRIKRRVKDTLIASPLEGSARRLYAWFDNSRDAKYDRETIVVMPRLLSDDYNCVDVGAHRGKILRQIRKVTPKGTRYAFEPVPESYEFLRKRYS